MSCITDRDVSAEAADDDDAQALRDELRLERRRHFDAQRLTGPVGVLAASFTFFYLSRDLLTTGVRLGWMMVMIAVTALMLASLVGPFSRRTWRDGLPLASHVAHLAVGVGWGVVLWLDLDATRGDQLHWLALMLLIAITAGSSAGLSGSNVLGRNIVVSMWSLAIAALLATGRPFMAVAFGVFVALMLAEIATSRDTWEDLVRLRLHFKREASLHHHAASHDGLTSLLNRTGLTEGFDAMPLGIARSAFYIDLDGFKTVNDRYGHRFGDLVLIEVARRLRAMSPADGLVARIGGDEFVVVVAGPSGDDLSALAASLHEAITSPVTGADVGPVRIGASVGSASSGDADIDLDDLLDRADRAQYRAKQDGHRRRAC